MASAGGLQPSDVGSIPIVRLGSGETTGLPGVNKLGVAMRESGCARARVVLSRHQRDRLGRVLALRLLSQALLRAMVQWLGHRPVTAEARVQFPLAWLLASQMVKADRSYLRCSMVQWNGRSAHN
jgi:hypothetical protein